MTRTAVLVAFAVPMTAAGAPAPDQSPGRFLQVQAWSCTWSVKAEYVPSGGWSRNELGNGTIDLVAEEGAIEGGSGMWTGEHGKASGTTRHTESGGGGSQASGTSASEGSLQVDTQEGNRNYTFSARAIDMIPGTWEAVDASGQRTSGTSEYQIPGAGVSEALPKNGLGLTGVKVERDAERTLTTTWSCTPKGTEEYELLLEAVGDYDKWLPQGNLLRPELPGSHLTLKATFQKKGGGIPKQKFEKVVVTLNGTSREKGIALNFPKQAPSGDFDLRFPESFATLTEDGQRAEIEPGNTGVLAMTIPIDAYDFGAFSTLRAVAFMADGLEVIGRFKPTGAEFVLLPRDDDGNHVADWWQKEKRIPLGTLADSDEDPQLGRANAGDGIPLYEEYRGFVRLKAMTEEKVHERTDPRLKTLFVVDEQKLWNFADWADATAMESFRLDGSLVSEGEGAAIGKLNATDFLRGFAKAPGFDYAVRLELDESSTGDPEQLGYTDFGGAPDPEVFAAKGPRDTRRSVVFSARIKSWVEFLPSKFERALGNPDSPLGRSVDTQAKKDLLRRAMERLKQPARRKALAEAITRKVIVHEVGHACGVDHHGLTAANVAADMTDAEFDVVKEMWLEGERACPTRYFNKHDLLAIMILEVLFPREGMILENGRFCSASTCWPSLTVKEW